jgi:hypothetical protein
VAASGRRRADALLVAALAGGQTVRDAAKTANVGETTVYRRLNDPSFRRAVADARRGLVEDAAATLARCSSGAATTLALLMSPSERPAVRLQAAKAVIELAVKTRQAVELEERVAALEAASRPGIRRVG